MHNYFEFLAPKGQQPSLGLISDIEVLELNIEKDLWKTAKSESSYNL